MVGNGGPEIRRTSVTLSNWVVALALVAGACASSDNADRSSASHGSAVTFTSIAHGDPPRSNAPRPTVYVALDAKDLARFDGFVDPIDRNRVAGTDLSADAVIAVFDASTGSSGRAITVKSISVAGATLRIVAERTGPAGSEPALTVFTTPYDVIAVDRSEVARPGVSACVVVDPTGHELARRAIGG
jgi:hypothetical protein